MVEAQGILAADDREPGGIVPIEEDLGAGVVTAVDVAAGWSHTCVLLVAADDTSDDLFFSGAGVRAQVVAELASKDAPGLPLLALLGAVAVALLRRR